MQISFNWLKELIDIPCAPQEVAERLTMVGLAVESVLAEGDDYILEFDLTSNRPDALSHYGVARELAAILGSPARLPSVELIEDGEHISRLTSVEILNPELCPRYSARVIRGVRVEPSPAWLVERLARVGQRSINNIADITNLVLWEQGHPLHAFDFNRLAGRRLIVRTAREGETLKTLDGVERKLSTDMLVIADGEKPSAIAGIMGGEYSEISNETCDVLLESAYFSPTSIRKTARSLEMSTEASYRFERGADPEACVRALNRCAQLIQEIAGGTIAPGVIDLRPKPAYSPSIELRSSRIRELTGLEVAPNTLERILKALGFSIDVLFRGERWMVVPPSYRIDLHIEEDVVEEVVRHIGYNQIPLSLPPFSGSGSYLANEQKRRSARDFLIAAGYAETITFSWVRPELDAQLRPQGWNTINISNPIDDERPIMRSSLLSGLLDGVVRNFNFGIRNIRLFEFGRVYRQASERPDEFEHLSFVATGQAYPADWGRQQEVIDFYSFKGTVESLLENMGYRDYKFTSFATNYLHSGQAAEILVKERPVGVMGQLSPALRDELRFKQPVFVCELDLGLILSMPSSEITYRPLPRLQAVSRDLSIIVPRTIVYAELEQAIMEMSIPELVSVRLFDIYSGKGIADGKVSLSISLKFQPTAESMTDEQIASYDKSIVEMLQSRFQAQLRG